MNPKIFWLITAIFLAPLHRAEAQQTRQIPRIGVLEARSPSDRPQVWLEFRQGLRDLGYIEGKNIVLEFRYADGNNQRLPDLAADLVRLKVDVIVASDSFPASAASKATKTIPIVVIGGRDAVEAGLAASLSRPGGNVTGLTNLAPELLGKRLELLKETVPRLSRVTILIETSGGGRTAALAKDMVGQARSLGIQFGTEEVRGPNPDFNQAFQRIARSGTEAIIIGPMPPLVPHMKRIVDLSAKHHYPTMAAGGGWVDAGALMSYGANTDHLSRRAATYVDHILKGARPADMPIEQPTKFELIINLKAAKQIGLVIPPNVLARADRVIR
jgi:ABC-type uncharacterized transport system substrate-binding protein